MINWEDIKTFLAVAETLNLSEAARRMEIDQTTVFRRIQRLEKQTQQALFFKDSKGYRLTEFGQLMANKSASWGKAMIGLEGDFLGDNAQETTNLRLGTTPLYASYCVFPILKAYRDQYPSVTLEVEIMEYEVYRTPEEKDFLLIPSKHDRNYPFAEPIIPITMAFFATPEYLQGKPRWGDDRFFVDNDFIMGQRNLRQVYSNQWLQQHVPVTNQILKVNTALGGIQAIKQHLGIGCLPAFLSKSEPDLVMMGENFLDIKAWLWLMSEYTVEHSKSLMETANFLKKQIVTLF